MIYTVTLNPALDRAIDLEELVTDDANRIQSETRYAGGKGIDASRLIKTLGGESIALGFVGGFHGMELEHLLLRQGVQCDFIETRGETRTNILIFEKKKNTHTSLNASGQVVNEVEISELLKKMETVENPAYVIVSGSVPKEVPENIYKEIVGLAKGRGAIVALDADDKVMKAGLEAKPHIIKPNMHELERITGREIHGVNDAVAAARDLQKKGIEIVLVTMGKEGALLVTDSLAARAIAPEVVVQSTVGAGDCFLAAFILAHSRGQGLLDCLRLAAATGSAASITPGTELARKSDVDSLYPRVLIEEI